MRVVVEGGEWIARYTGNARVELEVEPGCTAAQAAERSGVPSGEIGMLLRAQERIAADTRLNEGDVVKVMPPILGG